MSRLILRSGAIAVAVIVATFALAFARHQTPTVVVVANDGKTTEVRLGDASRFSLSYVHSVYERPVVETFEVDGRGGFVLVHVSSPSEKTLDYYGVEGRRSSRHGWRRLTFEEPPRFTRLPLIATATGRRTLQVGDQHLRLYDRHDAAHVTICIGPSQGCS